MNVTKMAWRNLWRNRRRTTVTVGAMSLALLATILYSGLMAGMLEGLERNVVELEVGDVQMFSRGYLDRPQIYTRLDDTRLLLQKLERAGFRASARLLAAGLAAAGEQSSGVSFRGVEVARDRQVSQVHRQVVQGRWLDEADPTGIVLGRRLARTLDVKVKSEIVVLTQGADGSMANEVFHVRGILRAISDAVDRSGIYMTDDAFRRLLVIPRGTHQIIVRRPDGMSLEAASARIKSLVSQTRHEVQTWKELMPTLASLLESARGTLYVMFLIVYIAIAIVILNTMLMAVFERIREFGVLKALGMGPSLVLRLVLTESALQTLLAICIGIALSVPGIWYCTIVGIDLGSLGGLSVYGIAWDMVWRAKVSPEVFTGPVVLLVVMVFIAVLYPAIKAALIRPLAAIQHR